MFFDFGGVDVELAHVVDDDGDFFEGVGFGLEDVFEEGGLARANCIALYGM